MTFKEFFFDLVIAAMIFLFMVIGSVPVSIIVSGSRGEGAFFGFFIGMGITLILFYVLRTQFGPRWTAVQVVVNMGLTILEFIGFVFLIRDIDFFDRFNELVVLIVPVPILIALNKAFLEHMLVKRKVKKKKNS